MVKIFAAVVGSVALLMHGCQGNEDAKTDDLETKIHKAVEAVWEDLSKNEQFNNVLPKHYSHYLLSSCYSGTDKAKVEANMEAWLKAIPTMPECEKAMHEGSGHTRQYKECELKNAAEKLVRDSRPHHIAEDDDA